MIHEIPTHAVKVPFQSVDVGGPEPAELLKPGIHLTKRFRFEPVDAALRVDGGLDETGVPQNAQMFGDGRLRHAQLALDLADRLLGRDEEAEDCASVRFGDDFEDRFHVVYIRHGEYTWQGI